VPQVSWRGPSPGWTGPPSSASSCRSAPQSGAPNVPFQGSKRQSINAPRSKIEPVFVVSVILKQTPRAAGTPIQSPPWASPTTSDAEAPAWRPFGLTHSPLARVFSPFHWFFYLCHTMPISVHSVHNNFSILCTSYLLGLHRRTTLAVSHIAIPASPECLVRSGFFLPLVTSPQGGGWVGPAGPSWPLRSRRKPDFFLLETPLFISFDPSF